MKILMSSCLFGENVMYWGGNYQNNFLKTISEHPEIELTHFCPEHFVLGTPRNNMLIHNGAGDDIWDGRAKLLDTAGNDCTEKVKDGALKMLEIAQKENPDLIILTEGSDSCGSQVILDPETGKDRSYQFKPGMGIAASILSKNGFRIIGHKNEKQIYDILRSSLKKFPEMTGLENLKI